MLVAVNRFQNCIFLSFDISKVCSAVTKSSECNRNLGKLECYINKSDQFCIVSIQQLAFSWIVLHMHQNLKTDSDIDIIVNVY